MLVAPVVRVFLFRLQLPVVVVDRRLLVLLVLGHEVVDVRLRLRELHLVHALARVPVQERSACEHRGELLEDAPIELLDGGVVTEERAGKPEAARRDVADRRLHVVRDPLDEVAAVLRLNVQHLLVDLDRITKIMNINCRSFTIVSYYWLFLSIGNKNFLHSAFCILHSAFCILYSVFYKKVARRPHGSDH